MGDRPCRKNSIPITVGWASRPRTSRPTTIACWASTTSRPNPDVIEAAADQRMAHLKRFNTGKHSALAERLLNEVAAARMCLLNPAKKAIYDQALRQQFAARAEPADDSSFLNQFQTAGPLRSPAAGPGRARKTKAKTKTPWIAVLAVAAGLAAVVLIVVRARRRERKTTATRCVPSERRQPKRKEILPPAEQKSSPPPEKQKSVPPPRPRRKRLVPRGNRNQRSPGTATSRSRRRAAKPSRPRPRSRRRRRKRLFRPRKSRKRRESCCPAQERE